MLFRSLVAVAPVVGGAHAVFADVEVFGVIDVFVGAGLNAVDDLCFSLAGILYPPSIILSVISPPLASWLSSFSAETRCAM